MRTSVAIVLIIMGSLLLTVPVVFDIIHEHNVVSLMNPKEPATVTLPNSLEGFNRFGYWLTGTLMVLVGVVCAFRPAARSTCNTSAVPAKSV